MGFPSGSAIKNSPAKAGDMGSIPGSKKIPWRRKRRQPIQYSYLGNPADRGTWKATVDGGAKESDVT